MILRWHRHLGRCLWTGLLGALGLVTVLIGWIGLLGEAWNALAGIVVGVAITVLAEWLSRRPWAVTTHGLQWPVPFGTARLGWAQVRAGTQQAPPRERRQSDRIVVHRPEGSVLVWPRPQTNGRCVDELQWWSDLHRGVPHGDWRAVPDLRLWQSQPSRSVANPGGRWLQGVLSVIAVALAVGATLMVGRSTATPTMLGWALAAVALVCAALWAVRRAVWSIGVHPTGLTVQHFPYRKEIAADRIVGCVVEKRPKLVSLGVLTVLALVLSLDLDADAPDHRYVPTLVLVDGTAVPLMALATRSRARAEALALRVMDPQATGSLPS